jgi:hypothetical protein
LQRRISHLASAPTGGPSTLIYEATERFRKNPALLLWPVLACNCFALGQIRCVETMPENGAFSICEKSSVATICVDKNDFAGGGRAAGD